MREKSKKSCKLMGLKGLISNKVALETLLIKERITEECLKNY